MWLCVAGEARALRGAAPIEGALGGDEVPADFIETTSLAG
jgi:hypothetical protein